MRIFFILFLFCRISPADIYTQNCRVVNEDDYVTYSIESDFNQGDAFTQKVTAYEDANCKTAYLHFTQYFKIKKNSDGKIDLQTSKTTYTSLSNEVTESLNFISYCGLKNWATDKETDVTGKKCDSYQQLAKNQLFYQIIELQSEQQNFTLRMGEISSKANGRSESTRPVDFEQLSYRKK